MFKYFLVWVLFSVCFSVPVGCCVFRELAVAEDNGANQRGTSDRNVVLSVGISELGRFVGYVSGWCEAGGRVSHPRHVRQCSQLGG